MTPEVGPRLTGRALRAVPVLPQALGGSSACTGTEEALGWDTCTQVSGSAAAGGGARGRNAAILLTFTSMPRWTQCINMQKIT